MSHKASLACTGAFAAAATLAVINPALSHTVVGNRVFPETFDIQHVVIIHLGRALGPGTYSLSWLVGSIDTPRLTAL
jgi:methionine-rich copper-binding protein CopC